MHEVIGREKEQRLDIFARAEPVSENFLCAGLFQNSIDEYLGKMAKVVRRLIDKKDAYEEFKKLLEEEQFVPKGDALYSREAVNRWLPPYRVLKSGQKASFYRHSPGKKFNICKLKVSSSSDFGKRAGMVFLRVKGYEDAELSGKNEWKVRKDVLEVWLSLTEDEWVKDYLGKVKDVLNFIEYCFPDTYWKKPFRRLAFYLFPIAFDRFENSVIISKASLYRRKEETRKNLWGEIVEELKKEELFEEFLGYLEESSRKLDDVKTLLELALGQEALDRLRRDWKAFLKKILDGSSSKIVGAFLEKGKEEGAWMSYGEYLIPKKDIDLYLFYEEGAEDFLDTVRASLEHLDPKYIKDVKVRIVESYRIEKLFGSRECFSVLKGLESEKQFLEHLESIKLLYSLLYFTARLVGFWGQTLKNREKFTGVLLLLNTDLEMEEKYAFWNHVSFLYSYYGFPFQTITKRFIGRSDMASVKNMLISLYKDAKVLNFEFDGFSLPPYVTIFAVLEKLSPAFFYKLGEIGLSSRRHSLCEVYRIDVKEKKATVMVEDKILIIAGGEGSEVLESFIEANIRKEDVRFCFISPVKRSFLEDIYGRFAGSAELEGKFLNIRYREMKTAYVSQAAEENCLVIYAEEFRKLLEKLGITLKDNAAAVAIKPAKPTVEEEIYHPAIQVFFTEKPDMFSQEMYQERMSLFLFTVMALSMFESEAARVPYSKLDIWMREKNNYIRIRREDSAGTERVYTFPLKAVLYEMLEFMKHLPAT